MNTNSFLVSDLPIFSFMTEEELKSLCDSAPTGRGFNKLDSIYLNDDEINMLISTIDGMTEKSITYFEKPALNEFELKNKYIESCSREITVRYKKSVLCDSSEEFELNENMIMYVQPYIDMHISFWNPDIVDSIVTAFTFVCKDKNGKIVQTGTMNREIWRDNNDRISAFTKNLSEDLTEFQRYFRLIYIAIQKAIYEKPTVFVTESYSKITNSRNSVHKSKNKKKKNKVKIVKRISINRDELKKYAEPQKHMSCPSWGVVGHWRNYKSGKKVWIQPYRKGRERNNPISYCPKTYSMEV